MFEQYDFRVQDIPFGRYGSYLTIFDEGTAEEGKVIIASTHSALGAIQPSSGQSRSHLLHVSLCSGDGKPEPCTVTATPGYVLMTGAHGSARISIDARECVRIASEDSAVRIDALTFMHEIAKDRNDGSWELCFIPSWKMLIQPVRGKMIPNAEINWLETKTENVRFIFEPEKDGAEAAVHLYESNMLTPSSYPPFDQIVAENEKSFGDFLSAVPDLPEEYRRERILTSYCVWSNMMLPGGMVHSRTMFCSKKMFALGMAWHQSYAAMVFRKDPALSWDLITSMFYQQDPYGMLPDWIKDRERTYMATKPPIQGYAVQFLLERGVLDGVDSECLIWLYERLEKLHNWWMSFRDTDRDGIPQYDSGDESGWDDATIFSMGVPVESPDLCTYLIFVEEALSGLAGRIGLVLKAGEWKLQAEKMLERLIDFFWDGERFTARKNATHERVPCFSTVSYQPLLLGKRLPEPIRQRMIGDLSKEGDYLTPYGFASERLDSPLYRPTSWLAGSINTAMNFQLITGLWDSGAWELAREAASRFVRNAVREFWPFSYDAYTGKRLNRPSSQQPLTSWMSVFFLGLAGRFLTEEEEGES